MRAILCSAVLVSYAASAPFPGCKGGTLEGCPGTQNCSVHYLEQNIDHFNWAAPLGNKAHTTFKQRFFVHDQYWDKANHGPVFFYFGNEDNVELYVNHTGLMWESAASFGALLVFGEHRFYGKSLPYAPGVSGCMNFLTTEQAMADFAYLIDHLREQWGCAHSAFIGFGGSYGGMLGSWFRVHYPNAIDGVIAASAPIWSFAGLDPPYDFNAFNEAVTFDASAAGDYPYASSYLMHGQSLLPAWPVRVACKHLANVDAATASDATLFAAVREAAATFHNNTGAAKCFNITGQGTVQRRYMTSSPPALHRGRRWAAPTDDVGSAAASSRCEGDWGFQWCTEMVQPFTQGTPHDMFYCPPYANCSAWNVSDAGGGASGCERTWGVTPRPEWARIALGGKRIEAVTNIVFSNGLQDPWHGGGVLRNLSATTLAILIPNGAHHIDLMFSDPADAAYPDIGWAREFERTQMARWVREHRARHGESS